VLGHALAQAQAFLDRLLAPLLGRKRVDHAFLGLGKVLLAHRPVRLAGAPIRPPGRRADCPRPANLRAVWPVPTRPRAARFPAARAGRRAGPTWTRSPCP